MAHFAKVFHDGTYQTVRLPEEYNIHSDEVMIEKIGSSILLIPKQANKWDVMRSSLTHMEDFEFERFQPEMQERYLF